MLTAAIGLLGVAVGALLSQLLAAARERRLRRLDALADAAAACACVLGAQERIYDLFAGGVAPSLAAAPADAALRERSEALAHWRAAEARLLMLLPEDRELLAAVEAFGKKRALATQWIRAYQEQGERFDVARYRDEQEVSWQAVRDARHNFMSAARRITAKDARLFPGRRHWRTRAMEQQAARALDPPAPERSA